MENYPKDYREKEYHDKVWETAKSDTKSYFRSNMRARIGEVISGVVVGGISLLANKLWGGEVMPLWVSILTMLVGILLGMWIFHGVIYFGYGFWSVPARVFRKLEIKANKYTWEDLKIDIFEPTSEDNPTVRLDVTNTKPYDIKAEVFILEMTRDWLIEDEKYLPLHLGWTTTSRNPIFGEIQLDKESVRPTYLLIAAFLEKTESAYLIIESSDKDTSRDSFYKKIDKDSDYRITLMWRGKVDNQKMDDFYTSYWLRFDGKKIKIKPAVNH